MSELRGRKPGMGDREDHLDLAIDRAVREMLDVEPQADVRARVLTRIDALSTNSVASAFRWKIAWGAIPLAAAARSVGRPSRSGLTISAAVALEDPDADRPAADTPTGPAPLTIEGLKALAPTAVAAIEPGRSIEPTPLQIRPLEVTALPEAPPDRREE